MGFRASPLAVEVNGSIYRPGTLDFEDSGSVTFLDTLIGNLLQLQAFTGTLVPGSVQPGMPGLLVSTGGSGALDTEGAISSYYSVENYKAHYDNGFRLQFRGVWNVDAFVSSVGLMVDDGFTPIFFQLIKGYTPTLTVTQDAYTDWQIVDLAPPVGMTDNDPMLIALAAGNDSIFFGWSMLGATVEYRWVDQNADPTGTAGAIVLPGTVDGQIPIWVDQQEVYTPGGVSVEGVDVLSTGESAALVLTTDGADGASWEAPGGANVGGVQVWRGTVQSIPDATDTAINFGNKNYDTDSYAPGIGGGNFSTTITIPTGKGGVYLVTFGVAWANSPGTFLSCYPELAAGGTFPKFTWWALGLTTGQTSVMGAVVAKLNDGDTVKLFCRQESGGALDMSPVGGGVVVPNLTLARIGD